MNRFLLFRFDWGLVFPIFVLLSFSFVTLFSINPTFFQSQIIYALFSFCVFLFFSQINYRILQIQAWTLYAIAVVLLLIVLIIGVESRGAVRWIDIFGIRIQFSEILKPFFAIWLAAFLSERVQNIQTFLLAIVFSFPIFFLVLIQPDLGSALIYVAASGLLFLIYGFPMLFFGISLLLGMLSLPLVWQFLHQYQKQRIITFIHPSQDPLGTSYNAIQAVIAVGAGMFLGRGFSNATQSGLRFLPERHTDFIFATISEGLGFLGISIVVVAFCFLLYRIYMIYLQADETFVKLYAAFTFSLLLVQFVMNAGMNVGLLPVVGVTLPFISYGGSSLLATFILLGILSSMANHAKRDSILEIH